MRKLPSRIPGDKNLLYFLNLIGKPIISTSANLSGQRTCKNIEEISAVLTELFMVHLMANWVVKKTIKNIRFRKQ
ncbi:MAG: hypothetical protein CM15mP31_1950 [Gammaproteobacteria bacterium]|nr:MAG: hypothetical protein CM15mP31_1950 [Gammaproteobacteria bacterium]